MLKSIKLKMIVIISLLILLLVAGSSYFAYIISRNILEDTLGRTAQDAAQKNATIFTEKLLGSINVIKNLDISYLIKRENVIDILNEEIFRNLYWEDVSEGFKVIVEEQGNLETIFAADVNGNYTNTSGESGNIFEEQYFQDALKNKKFVLSNPIRQGDRDFIVIARPVVFRDKVRVILGGMIGLDYLNEISSDMNINGYGHAWVINKKMNTIVHPNREYYSNQLIFEDNQELLEIAKEMSAGKSGVRNYLIDDQEQQITFVPIEATDWSFALTASSSELLSPLSTIRKGSLLAGLLAIILGVIITYFISSGIVKPLIKLTRITEIVAAGDLTQKINNRNNEDEISRLSNSINNMIDSLRTMIGKVAKVSEQVASYSLKLTTAGEQVGESAEHVGISIQNVAAGAEEQANQVEKTAVNIRRLIEKIAEINNDSNTMNGAATHVLDDIKKGNDSVNYSIDNINNVKTVTSDVAKIVNTLGGASKEIDKIVGLINGIAAQTNLLALNAAIEAARAGNAGKGFSVVADEIRQLAEESTGATEQIADLISKIQNDVNNAVVKMDDNIQVVDDSVEVIDDTGSIFNEIEREAGNLISLINGIVKNTQTMTSDSSEVEIAINELISLSEHFASNSEEVAASSEEQIAATEEIIGGGDKLKNVAEELINSIGQFKLE